MLQSHGAAQGDEELGDKLWTVSGQNQVGQTVGHNKTVQEGFSTLRCLYFVRSYHPGELILPVHDEMEVLMAPFSGRKRPSRSMETH